MKKNSSDSFFFALSEVFNSFGFVSRNKGMIKYFIIPFIFNIIVLVSVFYFVYTTVTPMAKDLVAGSEWYMRFLSMIISPVIFVALMIFSVLAYSTIGGIVTSPFLDLLSEKTERCAGIPGKEEGISIKSLIIDIYRALMNTIKLLLIISFINILLLFLVLIPGGSFLYAGVGFISSVFFYGFQFYDFPLERIKYSFSRKLKLCWRYKKSVCGTGTAFFLLSFIPVVGFLGLNLCTVAATLIYAKKIRPTLTDL